MNVVGNEYFPRLVVSCTVKCMDRWVPGHIHLEPQGSASSGPAGRQKLASCGVCVIAFPSLWKIWTWVVRENLPIFGFHKDPEVCRVCMLKKSDNFSLSWSKPSTGSIGISGVLVHPPNFKVGVIPGDLGLLKLLLFSELKWSQAWSVFCPERKQNTFNLLYGGKLPGFEKWQPYIWIRVLQLTSCVAVGTFASVSLLVNGENDPPFPYSVKSKWENMWKSPGTQ